MKKIKVLSIYYCDSGGGAAIASNRLNSILKKKVSLKQIVIEKRLKGKDIKIYGNFFESKILRRLRSRIASLITLNEKNFTMSLNILNSGLVKLINKSDCDIIHFHSINSETISLDELNNIEKPTILTAHDMWLGLGIFHYSIDKLIFFRKISFIKKKYFSLIDRYIKNKKKNIINKKNFFITSPSKWLNKWFRKRGIFSTNIPNTIDAKNKIKKYDKYKYLLELKKNGQILIYISNILNEQRKGGHFIKNLINDNFFLKNNYYLILIGKNNNFYDLEYIKKKNIIYLSYIKDFDELRYLLKISDLCLFPSLIDNLPNTIMESLQVGTPVIAFNKYGMKEMILHKKTGYLCRKFSKQSFQEGITKFLNFQKMNKKKIYINCKNFFEKNYGYKIIIKKYINLYKKILEKN
tara:strand:- start:790 stop:2016 length:1227 start_codon:yes stop_codon:yes gene_type:complete